MNNRRPVALLVVVTAIVIGLLIPLLDVARVWVTGLACGG